MNKRWIFTHLLPIFLVVIVVAGITIAVVPSFKQKFTGFIAKFGPKAEESTQFKVEQKEDLATLTVNTHGSALWQDYGTEWGRSWGNNGDSGVKIEIPSSVKEIPVLDVNSLAYPFNNSNPSYYFLSEVIYNYFIKKDFSSDVAREAFSVGYYSQEKINPFLLTAILMSSEQTEDKPTVLNIDNIKKTSNSLSSYISDEKNDFTKDLSIEKSIEKLKDRFCSSECQDWPEKIIETYNQLNQGYKELIVKKEIKTITLGTDNDGNPITKRYMGLVNMSPLADEDIGIDINIGTFDSNITWSAKNCGNPDKYPRGNGLPSGCFGRDDSFSVTFKQPRSNEDGVEEYTYQIYSPWGTVGSIPVKVEKDTNLLSLKPDQAEVWGSTGVTVDTTGSDGFPSYPREVYLEYSGDIDRNEISAPNSIYTNPDGLTRFDISSKEPGTVQINAKTRYYDQASDSAEIKFKQGQIEINADPINIDENKWQKGSKVTAKTAEQISENEKVPVARDIDFWIDADPEKFEVSKDQNNWGKTTKIFGSTNERGFENKTAPSGEFIFYVRSGNSAKPDDDKNNDYSSPATDLDTERGWASGNYYGITPDKDVGFDINVLPGAKAVAATDGIIDPDRFGIGDGWGKNRVWIITGGTDDYYYAHMDSLNVQPGQKVSKGDVLGAVTTPTNGSTHLHFGIGVGEDSNSARRKGSGLQWYSGNWWVDPSDFLHSVIDNKSEQIPLPITVTDKKSQNQKTVEINKTIGKLEIKTCIVKPPKKENPENNAETTAMQGTVGKVLGAATSKKIAAINFGSIIDSIGSTIGNIFDPGPPGSGSNNEPTPDDPFLGKECVSDDQVTELSPGDKVLAALIYTNASSEKQESVKASADIKPNFSKDEDPNEVLQFIDKGENKASIDKNKLKWDFDDIEPNDKKMALFDLEVKKFATGENENKLEINTQYSFDSNEPKTGPNYEKPLKLLETFNLPIDFTQICSQLSGVDENFYAQKLLTQKAFAQDTGICVSTNDLAVDQDPLSLDPNNEKAQEVKISVGGWNVGLSGLEGLQNTWQKFQEYFALDSGTLSFKLQMPNGKTIYVPIDAGTRKKIAGAKTLEDFVGVINIFLHTNVEKHLEAASVSFSFNVGSNKIPTTILPQVGIVKNAEGGDMKVIKISAFGPILNKTGTQVGSLSASYIPTIKTTTLNVSFYTGSGAVPQKQQQTLIGVLPQNLEEFQKQKLQDIINQLKPVVDLVYAEKEAGEASEQTVAKLVTEAVSINFRIDNPLPITKLEATSVFRSDFSGEFFGEINLKDHPEILPNDLVSYEFNLLDKNILSQYEFFYHNKDQYLIIEPSDSVLSFGKDSFAFASDTGELLKKDFPSAQFDQENSQIKIKVSELADYHNKHPDSNPYVLIKINPKIPLIQEKIALDSRILQIDKIKDTSIGVLGEKTTASNDLWRKIIGQVTFENGKPNDLGYVVGTIDRFNPQNPAFDYHTTIDFSTDQCSQKGNQWVCNYSLEVPAKIINDQKTTLVLYPTKINENDPVSGLIGSQVIAWSGSSLSEAALNDTTGELTANINTDAFSAYNSIINSSNTNQKNILPKTEPPVSPPSTPSSIIQPIIEPVADLLKLPGIIMNDEKKPENLLGFAIDKTTKAVANVINTKTEEKVDLSQKQLEEISEINSTTDAKQEEIKNKLDEAVKQDPQNSHEVNNLLAKTFENEAQRLNDIQNVVAKKPLAKKIKEFAQNLSADISNFLTKNTAKSVNFAFDKLSGFYAKNLGFIPNSLKSYFGWIYQHILFS